jgi:hypothetical protein
LFVCKIHQLGNLFRNSAIVIDRAFLNAIGTHNRISRLIAATAAAAAVNFYRVHLYLTRHTPSRDQLLRSLGGFFIATSQVVSSIFVSVVLFGGVNRKPKLHRRQSAELRSSYLIKYVGPGRTERHLMH